MPDRVRPGTGELSVGPCWTLKNAGQSKCTTGLSDDLWCDRNRRQGGVFVRIPVTFFIGKAVHERYTKVPRKPVVVYVQLGKHQTSFRAWCLYIVSDVTGICN